MDRYFKGEWEKLERNLANLKRFLDVGEKVTLYDLGSVGGTPPPFCWILEGVNLVNFEPDPRSESEPMGQSLQVAIGPRNMNTIYLNKRRTTSSLLRSNERIVSRYNFEKIFKDEGDIFHTVDEQRIETYGLDEIVSLKRLNSPDFLKIDVQGLTLEVLQSGDKSLNESVIGIQTEVEFLECYKGQKTFGSVHEHLYDRGFEIFKLRNLCKWEYKTDYNLKIYTGQETFCDLLYFRNIDSIDENVSFWSKNRAVRVVMMMLLYDLTDAAGAYLQRFVNRGLVESTRADKLKGLIEDWEGAFSFFYKC